MGRYILTRLLLAVPILLGVSVVTFLVMRALPGDFAIMNLGTEGNTDPQVAENLRHSLGLDRPLLVQYVDWLGRALQGDLGVSLAQKVPVRDEILRRIPVTFELSLLAGLVAVGLGVPLGLLAALKHGVTDWTVRAFNVIAISVPNFFLGTLMILFSALYLPQMATFEFVSFTVDPIKNLQSLLYPAVALGVGLAAVIAENTRSAGLEVLHKEYILVARAKGLSPSLVTLRHLLKNALIPIITVVGFQSAALLGGSIIIETIFALPGLGRLAFSAVNLRDYPTIQGIVLVVSATVVLINLATDLAYGLVDPRIRFE
jgi:ABC-type dipeptide/oligopeptide/nickel transport system permease component